MAVLPGGCELRSGHLLQYCWHHTLEAPASLVTNQAYVQAGIFLFYWICPSWGKGGTFSAISCVVSWLRIRSSSQLASPSFCSLSAACVPSPLTLLIFVTHSIPENNINLFPWHHGHRIVRMIPGYFIISVKGNLSIGTEFSGLPVGAFWNRK